jgi:enoyl-CoA hydratase
VENLKYSVADGVATMEIDRPAKSNSLSMSTRQELRELYGELDERPDVRVIVLRGAGKGFSAGHDQTEPRPAPSGSGEVIDDWLEIGRGVATLHRLWEGFTPIIASVHGYCIGAATELMLFCDLAVATRDCRFSHPAIRSTGGSPASMPYPQFLGLRRTKEFLWVAGDINGVEAERLGLVNRAVAPDELDNVVRSWAERIASYPRENIMMQRRVLHRIAEQSSLREAMMLGVDYDVLAHQGPASAVWARTVAELGLKAAMGARDAKFR